jgi:hypothetical protein
MLRLVGRLPGAESGGRMSLLRRPVGATETLVVGLLVGWLTACGGGESSLVVDGLSEEQYVRVMGRLAWLSENPPRYGTSEERAARMDSARSAALDAAGVTPDQLLAFSRSAGADAARMRDLARRIGEIRDSLSVARPTVYGDADGPGSTESASDSARPATVLAPVNDSTLRRRLDSLRRLARPEPPPDR